MPAALMLGHLLANVFARSRSCSANQTIAGRKGEAEPALRLEQFTRCRDPARAIYVSVWIRSFDKPQHTGSCKLALGEPPYSRNDKYCTIPHTSTPKREVFQLTGLLRRLPKILASFAWPFVSDGVA